VYAGIFPAAKNEPGLAVILGHESRTRTPAKVRSG
jgi:hypothetical protein